MASNHFHTGETNILRPFASRSSSWAYVRISPDGRLRVLQASTSPGSSRFSVRSVSSQQTCMACVGRGAEGCWGKRNAAVSQIFPEREWQHEDILIPPAEFCRYLPVEQLRVAPRDDDLETAAVVKRAQDAIPAGEMLNLIEEEKTGVSPCKLVERREELVHAIPGEFTQPIVLEIYEEYVLFRTSPFLQQRLNDLVHEVGFPRPSRPDDGDDTLEIFGFNCGLVSGDERGYLSLFQPFGDDGEQDISINIVYHGKQIR